VTPDRLDDLERFSLAHGRFRYCSCMRWRMSSTAFSRAGKEGRVAALDDLVRRDKPIGVLGYVDGDPIAWCSVAPRESYVAIERYRALPRIDAASVWSITCLFVDSHSRRQGVTDPLLRGAAAIEGYSVEPDARLYRHMGSIAAFERAGFCEVGVGPTGRRTFRLSFD
jgi:GNAT superfamily N-acetyltransferase